MKKLLLIIALSSCAFAADPCTSSLTTIVIGTGNCNFAVTGDPNAHGNGEFHITIPTGYVADWTHDLVLGLHDSSTAFFPDTAFAGTTGWDIKCASVTPVCATIYPRARQPKSYDVLSAVRVGGVVTITTKKDHTFVVGTNFQYFYASPSTFNASGLIVSTVPDLRHFTYSQAQPDGTSTVGYVGTGNKSWVGYYSNNADGRNDSGYVRQLLAIWRPILKPRRIYVNGLSSGAFMSMRLLWDLCEIIDGAGIVAGTVTSHVPGSPYSANDIESPPTSPSCATPVIIFAGTNDGVVPPCSAKHANFWQHGPISDGLDFLVAGFRMRSAPANNFCTNGAKANIVDIRCPPGGVTTVTTDASLGLIANDDIRIEGVADNTNFPDLDCNLVAGTSGTTLKYNSGLGGCYGNSPACTPGSISSGGTATAVPKYNSAQTSYRATGGIRNAVVEAYALNGGGHLFYSYGDPDLSTFNPALSGTEPDAMWAFWNANPRDSNTKWKLRF